MHLTHNDRKKINESQNMLQAALIYANNNIPVIPLIPNTKKPLITGGKEFENASTNEIQIRKWWKNTPNANIGIKPQEGYIILDFDDHKCDKEQKNTLNTYREKSTQSQTTAHGGEHRIYRTHKKYSSTTDIHGLDTRQSHTGYIVAAPSIIDGKKYLWKFEDGGIADFDPPNLKIEKTRKPFENPINGRFKESINEVAKTEEGKRHQKLLKTAIYMAANYATDNDFLELFEASISTGYPEKDAQKDINDAREHVAKQMKNIPSLTGIDLFNQINNFFNKYMWFDDTRCAKIITLWILHCFYINSFQITPRLYITASTYGAGKTRLIQCISEFFPENEEKSIYTSSITQSALYALIDSHIESPIPIFIDEWDTLPKSSPMYEAIRTVINSGWQPNGMFYRKSTKNNDRKNKVESSRTFAPLAIIGKTEDENESILQRSLIIKLTKKMSKEKLPNLRKVSFKKDAQYIRDVTRKYVFEHPIDQKFMEELEEPQEIDNREADLWEPLRAVAKKLDTRIYQHLPELYPFITDAFNDLKNEDESILLLEDIERIFQEKYLPRGLDKVFSGQLAHDLTEVTNSRWVTGIIGITQQEIANKLRKFGVKPKNMRINGVVAKGYERNQKFIKALTENSKIDYIAEVETFLKDISNN